MTRHDGLVQAIPCDAVGGCYLPGPLLQLLEMKYVPCKWGRHNFCHSLPKCGNAVTGSARLVSATAAPSTSNDSGWCSCGTTPAKAGSTVPRLWLPASEEARPWHAVPALWRRKQPLQCDNTVFYSMKNQLWGHINPFYWLLVALERGVW